MIKRYEQDWPEGMMEAIDGEWVKYEDHAAEVNRLIAKCRYPDIKGCERCCSYVSARAALNAAPQADPAVSESPALIPVQPAGAAPK